MAIRVVRDDAAQRLTVTVTGGMTTAETRELMSQQLAHGTWHYGVVYDLERMTTSPNVDELGGLAGHVDMLSRDVRRGPVAIVGLSNPQQVARVGEYCERLKADGFHIALFASIAEAERWLDAQRTPNG